MQTRMLALGGSLVLLTVACGGKVVVDGQSSGGTGAGGGVGGEASTGSTSSTGSTDAELCGQFCAVINSKTCPSTPSCGPDCVDAFAAAGVCKSALTDLTQCIIKTGGPSYDGCVLASECNETVLAYKTCTNTGPWDLPTCTNSTDGSCDCKAVCNGANLGMVCTANAIGGLSCVCSEAGSAIGTCEDPQAMSCGEFTQGCCAKIFGLGG
jgi:hypothetical protein